MLKMNDQDYIGKGIHRKCYVHPEDKRKCIKVVYFDHDKEGLREEAYYRHLEKRSISWEMIPKFYGEVDTDLGKGAVFDLVCDHDGTPAKNLLHFLNLDDLSNRDIAALQAALSRLKDYMIKQRVFTREIDPRNISCSVLGSGEFHLYLVDNLDNTDAIPVANYIPLLARKKVERKWKRFVHKMRTQFPQSKLF